LGTLLNTLEKQTGITPSDLAGAVTSGASIPDLLANAPNSVPGLSADALKNGLDGASGAAADLSSSDILAKAGLTADDLKLNKDGLGSSNIASGGGRSPAGKNSSLGDLLGGGGIAGKTSSQNGDVTGKPKVSADIQSALDKNGISSLTIFQIVHSQYVKQLPIMKGAPKKEEKFDNPLEAKMDLSHKGT
jgi:hypothetical protein